LTAPSDTDVYLPINFDEPVKSRRGVMPANAGIQKLLKILDPSFRREDGKFEFRTFYQIVNLLGNLISGKSF